MIKLFLRLYLLAIVLLLVWISTLPNLMVFGTPFLLENLLNGYEAQMARPVFLFIQDHLKNAPEQAWPSILQSLTPSEPHDKIDIEPIAQINLSATQKARLMQGKIVGTVSFFSAPIQNYSNGYAAKGYQRIGLSNQALVIDEGETQYPDYAKAQIWIIHFIHLSLAQNPQGGLAHFSQTYQVPLQLLPLDSLPVTMQNYLKKQSMIFDVNSNFNVVNTLYYLESPTQVLRVGPYPGAWYIHYIQTAILILAIASIVMTTSIILFLLDRDFKKLGRLAEAYGRGEFEYCVKISRLSAMFPLTKNLQAMGERIQKLIRSHKELSQAISHELKTPLSRLKFALSLVEEAKNAKARDTALKEAESAGNALGDLVNDLLLYTRFDREFFRPDTQITAVYKSLKLLIDDPKYNALGKSLHWQIDPLLADTTIPMSEPYFKILLDNLLSNACRYAHSKVEITASLKDQDVVIEVADDGPGIPEAYRHKIFEPFFSLDESRNKDLSGHGLGLAIVSRIIDNHKAKINVSKSETLGGALFTLNLKTLKTLKIRPT